MTASPQYDRVERVSAPPLAGVRVIECCLAFAGPVTTRYLANLGADVIKIESRAASSFGSAPAWLPVDIGPAGRDFAAAAACLDAEKRSLGLNLKMPEGRCLLGRLVAGSDVFVTNLSVPAMASLGLRYEDVSAWNPAIVYVGMSGFGCADGPYRDYRSFGPTLAALAGYDALTGDIDREPVMTQTPYLDYLAAYHAVPAILQALLDGQAGEIDVSQFAVAVSVLAPEILHAQSSGMLPQRAGNRHPSATPRGVFPCRGDDRWIAIEVRDDREWASLALAPGAPDLLGDAELAYAAARRAREDELEESIAEWTRHWKARELAALLQERGVAACPVQIGLDHVADPQLGARQFWRIVHHDRLGNDVVPALPMRFKYARCCYTGAAPSRGHDTEPILRGVLELLPAEIDALVASGTAELEAPLPEAQAEEHLERPWKPWAWPLLDLEDQVSSEERAGHTIRSLSSGFQGCRVLDIGDDLSSYGPRLLQLLGAEVVRIEAPNMPSPEGAAASFSRWVHYGKAVERLDLGDDAGRARFLDLAAAADVVYESLPPGTLEDYGLGWNALHDHAPQLVLVSVTAFGQTGPYARWAAGELGLWALSGTLASTGYPDRRPTAPPPVTYALVGAMGAIATLAALQARARTGVGDRVDVSAHETLVATANAMLPQLEDLAPRPRAGARGVGSSPWGLYQCADRAVSITAVVKRHWQILASWIAEETGNDAVLAEKWAALATARYRDRAELDPLVTALAQRYTADRFCSEAQRRGLAAMPVNGIDDLLSDPHLAATDFWQASPDGLGQLWPSSPFRRVAQSATSGGSNP